MAKARIVYQVEDKELDALQKQLDEIKKSNKEVEDSFKGSNEEIKKGGGALNDLKGTIAGLGLSAVATKAITEFAKLTQEVNKNRKEVALLTNETGKALDNITAKVRATSQVFNKDFNEVLRAANTISKEFGTSLTDSIDNINEGFLRGLDINGDYIHTLQEYSTFIKEAGLNQEQFNVLIQKQLTQGIYSDKGIDAIKEAVISIREMTPTTESAIRAIGINTDELIRDIQSGTTTYFEAVQKIAQRTQELSDPKKTGAILADVFRGAGEDAGNYIFTLGDVQKGYAEVTESQQKYIDNQRALLISSEDLNAELVKFSSNFSSATTSIQTWTNIIAKETLGVLNGFISAFVDLDEATANFQDAIKGLELNQLNQELEKLETQGPSLFEKLAGGVGLLNLAGRSAAERAEQIRVIKERIDELNTEAETNKINEQNEALEQERKRRAALAEVIKSQEEAKKKKNEKDLKEIENRERLNQVSQLEKSINEAEARQKFLDELDQIEIENAEDQARQLLEINRARIENEEKLEKESLERRRELIQTGIDGFIDILGSFNQLRIQQIDNELQANELARNRELELAEGNATKQAEINKKFDSEQAKLRNKQVQAAKQQNLFTAIINTARGVTAALATANIPLSILIGALGAAQIGFIAAQQPPKFAKGVIDLKGPGTSTSDSIPAYLSRGESVMTAEETRDFMPTLKAIRSREIKPEIINRIVADKLGPNITVNDYDKLAEAVINQPKFNMNMDENGFSVYMQRQMSSLSIKQSKYRM